MNNIWSEFKRERDINKGNIGKIRLSLLTYRIGYIEYHFCSNMVCKILLKILRTFLRICCSFLGCNEFPPKEAFIDFGLKVPHGFTGIVINSKCKIGKDCTLFHGVTLGAIEGRNHDTIIKIGDNVYIGAYAMILGDCVIGDNCKIGAGTKIIDSKIPENSTVVNEINLKIINH